MISKKQMSEHQLMKNVSWITSNHPNTSYIFEDDEERPDLIERYLSKIISNNAIILIVPIHRFRENNYSLRIEGPIDGYKILNEIYHFYNHQKVTKKIIKDLNEDDVFDYVKKVKAKMNNNREVHYIDLMGDLIFFEGISKQMGNVYFLELGS